MEQQIIDQQKNSRIWLRKNKILLNIRRNIANSYLHATITATTTIHNKTLWNLYPDTKKFQNWPTTQFLWSSTEIESVGLFSSMSPSCVETKTKSLNSAVIGSQKKQQLFDKK